MLKVTTQGGINGDWYAPIIIDSYNSFEEARYIAKQVTKQTGINCIPVDFYEHGRTGERKKDGFYRLFVTESFDSKKVLEAVEKIRAVKV